MLLAVGLYYWLTSETGFPALQSSPSQPSERVNGDENQPQQPPSLEADKEAFNRAVRLAQEAVLEGEVAETSAQWRAIAEKWREASTLMSQVSPDYERYTTAQNRTALYERNGEVAEEEAEKLERFGY